MSNVRCLNIFFQFGYNCIKFKRKLFRFIKNMGREYFCIYIWRISLSDQNVLLMLQWLKELEDYVSEQFKRINCET